MLAPESPNSQLQAALALVQKILSLDVQAFYLHGSAVAGGLRPQSDLDILAVVDAPLSDEQRQDLIAALLTISAPHPATPGGPRCIELVVCRLADLQRNEHPAKVEFIYGEWLRNAFREGYLSDAAADPEYTLLWAQARQQAQLLWGRDVLADVPATPIEHIRQAMRDGVEPLYEGLRGDERNVLLTLARMWRTGVHGDFVTKEQAAEWAIPRLPAELAKTLEYARLAYIGEVFDRWDTRGEEAECLAQALLGNIKQAL
ncbi:adenylyltransferase [Alcaligenes faecalis]|uniref:aminoglycoside adenylyltransferase domain-containing protein n=1 Tax=Alcaligenes faecalis TaxID=511 RepID=UPI0005F99963|nr:aminoglycoside adenylyltransferase domain-containing protein [Alcaligenes faecalis]ALO38119.1 adenylyltransferase [Alcaligenes faecalis]